MKHTTDNNPPGTPASLRQLRDARGFTAKQVSDLLAQQLDRASYDVSSVLKAEADGIFDVRLLKAYASVYEVSLETVMKAVGVS